MPTDGAELWSVSDLGARLKWARRFRSAVARDRAQLAALVNQEVGKPVAEALAADVLTLLASCRWHERNARRILSERRVGGTPLLLMATGARVRRVPLGRVGIIATWNYPVQLLGIQLVAALIAGNRVIVKPSERAPRAQLRLLELARWAGAPPGVLDWTEPTREAGPALLNAGGIDHLVFTGSTRVGRQIAAWAAERLIPTTLELSGCDTALVRGDADAKLAASSLWNGVTMNAGQTCMAPRRVLVHRSIYPAFIDALAPLAGAARPLALIDAAAAAHAFGLAADAVAEGGRALAGVLESPRDRWLTPQAIVECPLGAALVKGEHFGPVVAVAPVADDAEALAVHRRVDQHLSASIFTRDTARARALAEELGCTQVNVNDCVVPTAHPGSAIGGRGESGWGHSQGAEGLLAMTRPVYVTRTGRWFRAPTGPTPRRALEQLSSLIGWLYGGRGPSPLPPAPQAEAPIEPKVHSAGPAAHHTPTHAPPASPHA